MNIKKSFLCLVLLGLLAFTFFQTNSIGALKAEQIAEGVSVECSDIRDNCDVVFTLLNYDTSPFSLDNQISAIEHLLDFNSNMNINAFVLHADPAERDYLLPEEWNKIKNMNVFNRIHSIDASEIKISTGILPNNAFTPDGNSGFGMLSYISLPQIETISVNSFNGLKEKQGIMNLVIPDSVTTIEQSALVGVLSSMSYVVVKGDITNYYNEFKNANVNEIEIDASKQSQWGTIAYFEDLTNLKTIQFVGTTSMVVDLDQLFANPISNTTLSSVLNYGPSYKEFKATSFPMINSHCFNPNTTTSYIVKNTKIKNVPVVSGAVSATTTFDISANRIDYTNNENKTFYEANKATHTLGEQKPDFKIAAIDDIEVTINGTTPTITPSFVYADGNAIDFNVAPEWVDSTYFSTYAANVTFTDDPIIDMSTIGTYTRTFKSPHGVTIGTAKVIVKEASTTKETPTITLTSDASENPTSNDEITFTATLVKVGSADLNTNGTITFKDGDSELQVVNVAENKATYKGKLTKGTHTIKATYSGNSDFETVTSSDVSVTIVETTTSELINQSIDFEHAQQEMTYGDRVTENSITQSDSHGSGVITYTSSDPFIASVDENGKVNVHKVGSVTISAEIAEDATYASATGSYSLTIKPKKIQFQGYTIKDKEYDGTKTASFDKGTLILTDILIADENDLGLHEGTLTLSGANVGTHDVTFNGFELTGAASGNYILEYPSLKATITKATLQVVVKDVDKKQGGENPTYTYLITGFKNNELETTISGYTKPILTSGATKDSPVGDYAIVASGAMADNYRFTYVDGTLRIEASISDLPKADYVLTGNLGKKDWYVSEVVIKPGKDFVEVWNGSTWVKELRYGDDTNQELVLKFRKADGTMSEEVRKTIKVDTTKPKINNIEDGATYYLNRNFFCEDSNLNKVIIDGKEIRDLSKLLLVGNTEKTINIIVEDEAGNTTSLQVATKPIEVIQESIKDLSEENVTKNDESEIEEILKETNALLKDSSYQPSNEQKEALMKQKEKCETLLNALRKEAPTNDEEPSKDEETTDKEVNDTTTQLGVNTGDSSSMGIVSILVISIFIISICLRHMKKEEV